MWEVTRWRTDENCCCLWVKQAFGEVAKQHHQHTLICKAKCPFLPLEYQIGLSLRKHTETLSLEIIQSLATKTGVVLWGRITVDFPCSYTHPWASCLGHRPETGCWARWTLLWESMAFIIFLCKVWQAGSCKKQNILIYCWQKCQSNLHCTNPWPVW